MNDFDKERYGSKLAPIIEQIRGLTDEEMVDLVGAIMGMRRLLIPNAFSLEHANDMGLDFTAESWADFCDWYTKGKSVWQDECCDTLKEVATTYKETLPEEDGNAE